MDESNNTYLLMAAPLQGYTDAVWRSIHGHIYGGVSRYYSPFLRIEKGGVRVRDIKELTSSFNLNIPLTPQIIFKDISEFCCLIEYIESLGYKCVDLNLGCPFPPQVKRGRGSGLLLQPGVMADLVSLINDRFRHIDFSIKMRLGVNCANEWRDIVGYINNMDLLHVAVHPRTALQQYGGLVNIDEFNCFHGACRHKLIYNGDITCLSDIDNIFETMPFLTGIMAGRGLLGRPSLFAEWLGGETWCYEKRLKRLLVMHDMMFEHYSKELCGDMQVLLKIKSFWDYMEGEIGRKILKNIKKSTSLSKYCLAVSQLRQML
ncbi:tRNA-dihydrouridine synthase family protein [Muribaculum sp.]|jgi:tRNA-dihydrouridine synthase|uniref:tRNA-dihydrouridine synthase family protein n=1 Tax=Muribaculum sp. TaxID=1918611 RepID=UPI002580D11F|nr:tRNA-dihydrouridine synthase family protein [Muribaculum sp.]